MVESEFMDMNLCKRMPHFFSYKVNRRILSAFFLIIAIPILVSFGVTNFLVKKTMQKEIRTRLNEGLTVYFRELETVDILPLLSSQGSRQTLQREISKR